MKNIKNWKYPGLCIHKNDYVWKFIATQCNDNECSIDRMFSDNKLYLTKDYAYVSADTAIKKLLEISADLDGTEGYQCVLENALNVIQLLKASESVAVNVLNDMNSGLLKTALKKIENTDITEKNKFDTKCILYLLCLIELTLNGNRSKKNSDKIQAVLTVYKYHIEQNNSIFNWEKYIPSYLIFLLASELYDIGIDYRVFFSKANRWEKNWILHNGPFSDSLYNVLLDCIHGMQDENDRNEAYQWISIARSKEGQFDTAVKYTQFIQKPEDKILIIYNMLSGMSTIDKGIHADVLLSELITIVPHLTNVVSRCHAFIDLSSDLFLIGRTDEAVIIMGEAIKALNSISEGPRRDGICQKISRKLIQQHAIFKGLEVMRMISNPLIKCYVLQYIAINSENHSFNQVDILQEAIVEANKITDQFWRNTALIHIAKRLQIAGNENIAESAIFDDELLFNNQHIISAEHKLFRDFSKFLAWEGQIEKAINYADGITEANERSGLLGHMFTELTRLGRPDLAAICINRIKSIKEKREILLNLANELIRNGKKEAAYEYLIGLFQELQENNIDAENDEILSGIAVQLYEIEKYHESDNCVKQIRDDFWILSAIRSISINLIKKGKFETAFITSKKIFKYADNDIALRDIALEFMTNRKFEEAIICTRNIKGEIEKDGAFRDISLKFSEIGRINEALDCVNCISDKSDRFYAIKHISGVLLKTKEIHLAISVLTEHLKENTTVINDFTGDIIKQITNTLFEQGEFRRSIECANLLEDFEFTDRLLRNISFEYKRKGKWELSKKYSILMNKKLDQDDLMSFAKSLNITDTLSIAIKCASEIEDERIRIIAFLTILDGIAKDHNLAEVYNLLTEVYNSITLHKSVKIDQIYYLTKLAASYCKFGFLEFAHDILNQSILIASQIESDSTDRSLAFRKISFELYIQGYIDEAQLSLERILDPEEKFDAIQDIFYDLIEKGNVSLSQYFITLAESCLENIDYEPALSEKHQSLAFMFHRIGKKEESISHLNKISDSEIVCLAKCNYATRLAESGNFTDSLRIINEIFSTDEKITALWNIGIELLKKNKNQEAEKHFNEARKLVPTIDGKLSQELHYKYFLSKMFNVATINQIDMLIMSIPDDMDKQTLWSEVAFNHLLNYDYKHAISFVKHIGLPEDQSLYAFELIKRANCFNLTLDTLPEVLPYFLNDKENLKKILKKYALRYIYFNNPNQLDRMRYLSLLDFPVFSPN